MGDLDVDLSGGRRDTICASLGTCVHSHPCFWPTSHTKRHIACDRCLSLGWYASPRSHSVAHCDRASCSRLSPRVDCGTFDHVCFRMVRTPSKRHSILLISTSSTSLVVALNCSTHKKCLGSIARPGLGGHGLRANRLPSPSAGLRQARWSTHWTVRTNTTRALGSASRSRMEARVPSVSTCFRSFASLRPMKPCFRSHAPCTHGRSPVELSVILSQPSVRISMIEGSGSRLNAKPSFSHCP